MLCNYRAILIGILCNYKTTLVCRDAIQLQNYSCRKDTIKYVITPAVGMLYDYMTILVLGRLWNYKTILLVRHPCNYKFCNKGKVLPNST
jgi:hypothetical protein